MEKTNQDKKIDIKEEEVKRDEKGRMIICENVPITFTAEINATEEE